MPSYTGSGSITISGCSDYQKTLNLGTDAYLGNIFYICAKAKKGEIEKIRNFVVENAWGLLMLCWIITSHILEIL